MNASLPLQRYSRTAKTLRYLFVGTGRCGTQYTSRVLNSVDIKTGHESVFTVNNDKTFNGPYEAEVSWLAVPYLNVVKDNLQVIHLIRNPLEVAQSFWNIRFFELPPKKHPLVEFAYTHLPELKNLSTTLEKSVYWAVNWNMQIHRSLGAFESIERVKVEEGPERILESINRPHLKSKFDDKTANKYLSPNNKVMTMKKIKDINKSLYFELGQIMEMYDYK